MQRETSIQAALRDFLNSELRGVNLYRHYTENSCMELVKYTTSDSKKNISKSNREKNKRVHKYSNNSTRPRYETRSITKQFSKIKQ